MNYTFCPKLFANFNFDVLTRCFIVSGFHRQICSSYQSKFVLRINEVSSEIHNVLTG